VIEHIVQALQVFAGAGQLESVVKLVAVAALW